MFVLFIFWRLSQLIIELIVVFELNLLVNLLDHCVFFYCFKALFYVFVKDS